MSRILCPLTLCVSLQSFITLPLLHAQSSTAAPAAPDSGLYTAYFFDHNYQMINWFTCGYTQQTTGCYEYGRVGPFGNVGAMIESAPVMNGTTVTRALYVVDSNPGGGLVQLCVYKKTDYVGPAFVTTFFTLEQQIPLPLTGGNTVVSMAANKNYVFIGTDLTPQAIAVSKKTLAVTQLEAFDPPYNVTSITANPHGFVTVTYGGFTDGQNGYYTYDENLNEVSTTAGAWFILNTELGISTATFPPAASHPPGRHTYR